jgi:hypothetical protein
MSNRPDLFAPPEHSVLSLNVQAQSVAITRERSQFEVLVRHILSRFFNNELLASDDETKRVMQIACAIALPTLIVSLFLFPAYHAFPPAPAHRPFWPQTGDHYFYVVYSFLVMGAATVYEWDLLFPDILDIFVLSILPVSNRRLFFARVLALAIFLCLVQLGTSILGTLFLPMVAEQFNFPRHVLSHLIAVTMSGAFGATCFLSLQGILLNVVGERIFRRITPLLQGISIMLLLVVLLLCPTLTHSMEDLLTSGSVGVRYFPPFWFLGVYESLLTGASAPAIFHSLARTGCYALLFMLACTLLTYPWHTADECANSSKALLLRAVQAGPTSPSAAFFTQQYCATPPKERSFTSSVRPSCARNGSASPLRCSEVLAWRSLWRRWSS